MASVRFLKKDIDYLLSLVLEECVYVMENYPEADKEKIMTIAQQVILQHHELRTRVNHPDGKDNPGIVRHYMKSVVENLYEVADNALDQLSGLIQK